jgi:ribonuclease Z
MWSKKYNIPNTQWTIKGYSAAAFKTGFYIPQLDIMLDAGVRNYNKPKYIFITHTHLDHIEDLPWSMIRDGDHSLHFNVYGPIEAEAHIKDFVESSFKINSLMNEYDASERYTYHGLKPNDLFKFKANKQELTVQVFKCDHGILPTLSYGFSVFKNKLKKKYLGMENLVNLKKRGIEITEKICEKKFTFICDTTIKVFDMNPSIVDYPVIFIECTFILEHDKNNNPIDASHIYWSQLKPYVEKYKNKTFVLFHFSRRYKDTEIYDFFEKENMPNIYLWIY